MLAPEPFFEPRGTPFSEYHRIKALVELGHHVDLVTYPIGRDVELPNLRIFRSARPPFVRRVRIGPSCAKLLLDVCLRRHRLAAGRRASATTRSIRTRRWGWSACGSRDVLGIPHVYDMHSSLPQQLVNFQYTQQSAPAQAFEVMERRTIAADPTSIITICQDLQDA